MRRALTRRTRRIAPLARYVAARRELAALVHGCTPTRFLRRLDLVAGADQEPVDLEPGFETRSQLRDDTGLETGPVLSEAGPENGGHVLSDATGLKPRSHVIETGS